MLEYARAHRSGILVLVAVTLAQGCGPAGSSSPDPLPASGSPAVGGTGGVGGTGATGGTGTPCTAGGTPCGPGSTCVAGTCTTTSPPAPPAAACVNVVGSSTAAQVTHLPGPVKVGEVVSFPVPSGTISVTIVEQAVSAPQDIGFRPSATQPTITIPNTAIPLRVIDPQGNPVYQDNPASPVVDPGAIAALPAFFDSSSPWTGTLTVPNTTGGLALVGPDGLPAGSWSMVVSDYAYECTLPQAGGGSCSGGSASSTYDVTVITKQGPGGAIPATGTLEVAIYFATTVADGAPGTAPIPLSADRANAGNDPDLARMAQTLRSILGKAGLAIGTITYLDLPASVQAAYATGVDIDDAGTCGGLATLLRNAEPGNRLNIFFVSTFTSAQLQGANQVVGIDGTIPGAATIGGTGASGAAVATHDLRLGRCADTVPDLGCGADVTAYIIAHEAGHFLGLYHVTEAAGTTFDPLLDTPPCPCRTCAPPASRATCADAAPPPASPYQLSVADCTQSAACGGGDNLMFWLLDQASAGTLTADQQRVVRANPLVQ